MKEIEIYIDGASKGNPGHSSVGVVICQHGQTVKNIAAYIGQATNNVAEYTALIYGLQEGLIMGAENIKINTDSQTALPAIKQDLKIKSPNILPLYHQARHLMSAFKKVTLENIPRENNRGADKLANKAIRNGLKNRLFL